MSKAIIIMAIIVLATSCKSSKANCDAYGDTNIVKKEKKIS